MSVNENTKRENDGSSSEAKRSKRPEKVHRVTEWSPLVDENGNAVEKSIRRPKRKVAVAIGYCGTGYNGMQIQNDPNVKTIEADLFKAFCDAGAVSPENATDIKKNNFMRAARTDKGVHAAGNIISAKLIVEDEDIRERINAALPEQIRVWGIQRVTKSFDCRKMCSSRVYEYLLPTYSLLPPKPHSALAKLVDEMNAEHPGLLTVDEEGKQWWKETNEEILASDITQEQLDELLQRLQSGDQVKTYDSEGHITDDGRFIRQIKNVENKRRREYKISPQRLQTFRDAMAQYVGSHNFHNFTISKSFNDPSSRRYIMDTSVSDPFVIENTEWVSIKLHGQSFMMHQIRKMIAMACLVTRTGCPVSRISGCYGSTKINIPKAPSLGLLLEAPVYTSYNQTLEKNNHDGIDFTKFSQEMDAFKMKHIYDKIYSEEARDNTFYQFFGFIDSFKPSEARAAAQAQREPGEGEVNHIFGFLEGMIKGEWKEEKKEKKEKEEVEEKKEDVEEKKEEIEEKKEETVQA